MNQSNFPISIITIGCIAVNAVFLDVFLDVITDVITQLSYYFGCWAIASRLSRNLLIPTHFLTHWMR